MKHIMIKQFLIKQKKIAKGLYFTYLAHRGQNYDEEIFWDTSFYTSGISDRQTISPQKSPISTKYHYASVELLILRTLYNRGIDLNNSVVLDIGSGSGHWIDFYKSLGVKQIIGMDVSKSSIEYLKEKYKNRTDIYFYHGKAVECIDKIDTKVNIVNAIGVMFHIVDDAEWQETIKKISNQLSPNGLLIVGGHFGFINGINVQFDDKNNINKRLRSRAAWKRTLKNAGFSKVEFIKNQAYLHIDDSLPENNILIATK